MVTVGSSGDNFACVFPPQYVSLVAIRPDLLVVVPHTSRDNSMKAVYQPVLSSWQSSNKAFTPKLWRELTIPTVLLMIAPDDRSATPQLGCYAELASRLRRVAWIPAPAAQEVSGPD